jgi:A/G-specific adenine glycosylase
MRLSRQKIEKFHDYIFSWWKKHKRDLPWRHTHDPYHILVSEVMLQQTQVSRVLTKYKEFLEVFPTVESLAKASPAAVLRLWKGMGYNRRALYLKKGAEAVISEYGGVYPPSEELLTKLPGLGKYTARAILVFAYHQDVAPVDTNIRQIITHFFFKDVIQPDKVIQQAADLLVPQGRAWEWNQALMDYGALELPKIKRPRKIKKLSVPFRETNRFFRGRVIDALREKNIKEISLVDDFIQRYDRSDTFMQNILDGLVKDGLIERVGGVLSLPE